MKSLLIFLFSVVLFLSMGYSQTDWTKHPDNPLIVPDQDWETRIIAPNAVIYDKGQYHMWYTAGEFPALGGDLSIGHAVSDDGLSWTKDEANPVFTKVDGIAWDEKGVYKAAVLIVDSIYHMWYSGYGYEGGIFGIGHATSDDGLEWARDDSQPVLTAGVSGEWDYSRLAHPTVVYDGNMFPMWYGGFNGDGSVIDLGHAPSADGTVWTKDPQNPVISSEVAGWDSPQLDYPFAMYDGTTFHIWYNAGGFLGWNIGYASSADGTNWTKYDEPVLTMGESGSWNSRYLSMPVVLYDDASQKYKMWYRGESVANTKGGIGFAESGPVMVPDQDWETRVIAPNAVIYDNDQYHMWYTAGEFPALGGDLFIGHAVSDDGFSWTKDEGNPVFANGDEGSWDSRGAYKVTVLKTDTTYHMWYTGYASSGSPKEIGHATSDDGLDWTRDPANPVLSAGASGEWDHSRLAHPTVVHDGSMFHMWYGGYNGDGSKIELGHATSADGCVWTKDPANPVISSEVAGWDNPQLDYPFALYDGATFHIWYNGGGFLGWDIGYAKSSDGTNWTKYNIPFLTRSEAGAWDSKYLSMPVVLNDAVAQKYKMWYRGESVANTKGGIGFAEWINLPIITALEASAEINLPVKIHLSQNYPNPFNPVTTISYTVKMFHGTSPQVNLSIYNLLGQKVATLVDKKQQAGNYNVEWDATGFASGIYIYTLETSSGYKQSRKLVLLK